MTVYQSPSVAKNNPTPGAVTDYSITSSGGSSGSSSGGGGGGGGTPLTQDQIDLQNGVIRDTNGNVVHDSRAIINQTSAEADRGIIQRGLVGTQATEYARLLELQSVNPNASELKTPQAISLLGPQADARAGYSFNAQTSTPNLMINTPNGMVDADSPQGKAIWAAEESSYFAKQRQAAVNQDYSNSLQASLDKDYKSGKIKESSELDTFRYMSTALGLGIGGISSKSDMDKAFKENPGLKTIFDQYKAAPFSYTNMMSKNESKGGAYFSPSYGTLNFTKGSSSGAGTSGQSGGGGAPNNQAATPLFTYSDTAPANAQAYRPSPLMPAQRFVDVNVPLTDFTGNTFRAGAIGPSGMPDIATRRTTGLIVSTNSSRDNMFGVPTEFILPGVPQSKVTTQTLLLDNGSTVIYPKSQIEAMRWAQADIIAKDQAAQAAKDAAAKNTVSSIPSIFGGQAFVSNVKDKTFSELMGEQFASGYAKSEAKYWDARAKAVDWIPFAKDSSKVRDVGQFVLDLKTGGEQVVIGSTTKAVEIAMQGENLFSQAGALGVSTYSGEVQESTPVAPLGINTGIKVPRIYTEFGSSLWNTGSTPAMLLAVGPAVKAVSGLGGVALAATGLVGRGAATAATEVGLGVGLTGMVVSESGKVRDTEGTVVGFNLAKGIGGGAAAVGGFVVGSNVMKGESPLPFVKVREIPLTAAETKPYQVDIANRIYPLGEGSNIPGLGKIERTTVDIPFLKNTVTPGKSAYVAAIEIGGRSIPLVGKAPDTGFTFGPNLKIATNIAPDALMASDTIAANPTSFKVGGQIANDYFIKAGLETPISVERVGMIKEVANIVYRKEVPVKSSLDVSGKLNPENEPYSEFVAQTIRKTGSLGYGSQTAKLQEGLPTGRLPKDWDTMTPENYLKFAFGAKPKAITTRDTLLSGLNKIATEKNTGDIFSISKESELLIEVKPKVGESRHFIDMHTEGYLAKITQPSPISKSGEFAMLGAPRRTTDTMGTKISTLGEEATAKLGSISHAQKETGYGPKEHRIEKEIGDAFYEASYAAEHGDKFKLNNIIDKILLKPQYSDQRKVVSLLTGIRSRLPESQLKSLEAYEKKYEITPNQLPVRVGSPKPSGVNLASLGAISGVAIKVGFKSPSVSLQPKSQSVSPYSPSVGKYSPSISPSLGRSLYSPSIGIIKSPYSPGKSPSSPSISPSKYPYSPSLPPYSPSTPSSGRYPYSPSLPPYSPSPYSPSPSPSPSIKPPSGGGGGIGLPAGLASMSDFSVAGSKAQKGQYQASFLAKLFNIHGKAGKSEMTGFGFRPITSKGTKDVAVLAAEGKGNRKGRWF